MRPRVDLAALQRLDGVARRARDERQRPGAGCASCTASLPALLEELRQQGIPLTELRTHSATLEDVFVSLTGRHLRDE